MSFLARLFRGTRGSSSPAHIASVVAPGSRPVRAQQVRVAYAFTHEVSENSCRASLSVYDGDVVDASDVACALAADNVNLRHIAEMRFYSALEQSFIAKPADGRLPIAEFVDAKTGQLHVKFVSASPRSLIGPSVVVDPNVGFLLDTLNPVIRMRFNAAGFPVTRVYQAKIRTVGPRFCCSVRTQAGFVFKMPFKEVFEQRPIPIGRGIDLCWGLCITLAAFQDYAGFVVLVGVPVGFSVGASLIRGGTMLPVVHPENHPDFLEQRIASSKREQE
jgi:hypothetical protein